ncbi:unnamed protein product [Cuscuta campestris]|uniref:Aquaporin SIP2-1 n=1 Tax=Cuscuta campestris TaxID=132261 RepID=A0A484KWB8_9ASTE|nr:unnamed protein product [Cuscuta campestris]
MGQSSGWRLLAADFVMSFMWVWSSVLIKVFVYRFLVFGHHDLDGEILRHALAVAVMFFFAFLGKVTNGGAYNPLTVLASSISGDFSNFIFTIGARIPAQVLGSIVGVRLILDTFPDIGRGPQLKVDIHQGALTEGCLTFAIVIISLGLSRKIPPGSFFMKTWISSLSKVTLHVLGSDLTGGCMNPASVLGWAYARGDHITKEHIQVYWMAPIQGTLLAVWSFRLLSPPPKEDDEKTKAKKLD